MNFNISKFKNKFKKIFDKDPYAYELKPHSAWTAILSIFIIALIILGIISFYIYRSLSNDATYEQERIIPTSQTINQKELQEIIDFYGKKKIEFDKYLV